MSICEADYVGLFQGAISQGRNLQARVSFSCIGAARCYRVRPSWSRLKAAPPPSFAVAASPSSTGRFPHGGRKEERCASDSGHPPLLSSRDTKVRQGRIPELGSYLSPVHIKEGSNESSCWSSTRWADPPPPGPHPDSITACSSTDCMFRK